MFGRTIRRGSLAVVAAGVLLLAACGGGGGGSGATKTATGGKVDVNASDPFNFDVKTINASPGALTVNLHEKGNQNHTFTVPDLHFEIKVDSSNREASGTITLEAGKTYPFRCSFDGHAASGMTGKIVVSG